MSSSRLIASCPHARQFPLVVWLIPFALASTSGHAMLKCRGSDDTVSYASEFIAGASCSAIGSQFGQPAQPSGPSLRSRTGIAVSRSSLTIASPSPARPNSPDPPAVRVSGMAIDDARGKRLQGAVRTVMYAYVDNGIRYFFSSKPLRHPADAPVTELHFTSACFLCSRTRDINVASLALNTRAYRREIEDAALNFGVEQALVRAVIHAESNFEPKAISGLGAQGLMQLMPATARRFGVKDAFDATQNIRGGVQYLAWLLKRFDGDLDRALAGYNAGEGAVGRYHDVPPYPETQYYVSRVKLLADRYRSTP
jgi:soluble lytic murein transglycosylase-like protein